MRELSERLIGIHRRGWWATWATIGMLLVVSDLQGQADSGSGRPFRVAKIAVPETLLAFAGYPGDLRIGDLDGDGKVDFVIFRSTDHSMKPCFIGAFTWDGKALWRVGKDGSQPARPGPVTVYDLNGDGKDEVICFFVDRNQNAPPDRLGDIVIQVLDGTSGRVLRQAAPKAVRSASGSGANWVHQRLLVANFRGTQRARDFVVKLGSRVVAFSDCLRVLWTYQIPWNEYGEHSAYIPAVGDIDGDGRDEVNGGYYLLESDGRPRWAKKIARHMDSVAIAPWDYGQVRAICSGYGHVLNADGNILLKLGKEQVPHGQEVRVADFLPEVPGPEMILRNRGHSRSVITVDTAGRILHRFKLNPSPNHTGMEAVYWQGKDKPALLYNGGELWRGNGERFAKLPGLPEPKGRGRMDWHHCIPANVCSDDREEVVVYNPWEPFVWIFTPAPLRKNAFEGFEAGHRQYNVRLMD